MERGKPDLTVYTFELPHGAPMEYPDDELWTLDYEEAKSFASSKGYLLIANEYEWQDSELLEDFTRETECAHCGAVIERKDGTDVWYCPDYDTPFTQQYCESDEAPDHAHESGKREDQT